MKSKNIYILITTFIIDIIILLGIIIFNYEIVGLLKTLSVYADYKTIIFVINDLLGVAIFAITAIGLYLYAKNIKE